MKIYQASKSPLEELGHNELINRHNIIYSANYSLIKRGGSKDKRKDEILYKLEEIVDILVTHSLDETLSLINIFNSKIQDFYLKEKYESAAILRDEKNFLLEIIFKLQRIPKRYLEEVGIN